MARERRTGFTLPEDNGGAKRPGGPHRTTGVKRVTGRVTTSSLPVAGATARLRAVKARSRGSSWKKTLLLLILAGGGYYGYGKYQEYQTEQRNAREIARNVREGSRLRDEKLIKIAQEKELAKKKELARLKKEEEATKAAAADLERYGKVAGKTVRKAENDDEEVEESEEIKASPEFLEALAEATALLKKGEWTRAQDRYTAASALTAPEEMQEKAKMLGEAAGLFRTVTEETPLAVETRADELYWVTLKNGNRFRGHLDRERSGIDDLAFVKNGGGVQRLKPTEITEKKLMTQEQRDREMRDELKECQEKAGKDGVAWYLCGVKALEYNQKPVSVDCFFAAAEKDPRIAVNAVEFLASRLFAQAMYDRQIGNTKRCDAKIAELKRKYPRSRAALTIDGTLAEVDAMAEAMRKEKEERKRLAQMKKEEAARARVERRKERERGNRSLLEIDTEIETAASEIKDDGVEITRADTMKKRADDLIETAKNCDSRDVANRSYREALDSLRQAAGMYQKALDSNPGNREVERKLDEVRKRMYWCRKMQTLG